MIRPQNVKDSLPQTLAQKIIARAAGKAEVAVGEIEIGSVDLAMIHDSGGPRRVAPILERLGVEVWDPTRQLSDYLCDLIFFYFTSFVFSSLQMWHNVIQNQ